MEALFKNTAKLPRVEMTTPKNVIGKSTVESIQSGAVHGFVGMMENLIEKIRKELDPSAKVIATGGVADWIADKCPQIDIIDPFLTLEGMRIIYERNKDAGAPRA
jgi:type III pantothenate kinase